MRRSQAYEPAPDLPDRIVARVVHRRRVRRAAAATLAAAAAAVVAVVVLAGPFHPEEGSVRIDDGRTPGTTVPVTTTPGPPGESSTTTTTSDDGKSVDGVTRPPATPGITPLTPLSRHGIGPITAGMTLREAQDAARIALTPTGGGSGDCIEVALEGFDELMVLVVQPAASGDPMDGVVRAVAGSVLPTDEGVGVGQSRADLLAALGDPTRTDPAPYPWGSDGELLVFESGGSAYGALVVDDMVLGLQSGDPAWVGEPDGCPA
jgi:hypothetical protein